MVKRRQKFLSQKRQAEKIDWIVLPEFRTEGCKDTRRLFYICKRCNEKIGQMEAISRHYSDFHPLYIKDIKNLVGIREYMLAQAKIFINLIFNGLIRNVDIKDYNTYISLTNMIFNANSITYIKDFKKGIYNKELSTIYYNYSKKIIKEFINFNIEYLKEFLKCLDELNFKVPSIDNRKQLRELNLFSTINLNANQTENNQGYFFINNKSDNYEEFLKNLYKKIEENKSNINKESLLFPVLKNLDKENFDEVLNNINKELNLITKEKIEEQQKALDKLKQELEENILKTTKKNNLNKLDSNLNKENIIDNTINIKENKNDFINDKEKVDQDINNLNESLIEGNIINKNISEINTINKNNTNVKKRYIDNVICFTDEINFSNNKKEPKSEKVKTNNKKENKKKNNTSNEHENENMIIEQHNNNIKISFDKNN